MTIKRSLKIILTVSIVGFIVSKIGLERFVRTIETINPYLFLFAFFCFPLVVFVGSRKWYGMIRHEAKNATYKEALVSFLGGLSLGLLTPGRVGEFGRVAFIRDGRAGRLVGIAFVDRLIDLEVTLALGIGSVFVFLGYLPAFLLALAVLTGFFFIFSPKFFLSFIGRILHFLPFKEKLQGMLGGMASIPAGALISCLLFRLLASFIDIFQFYLLINSFTAIKFFNVLCVYPIIILTNILPLTIGGIGIREGTSILTLSRFDIAPEAAANASFLLFSINTLIPGLIGALFVSRFQFKKGARAI